MNIPKSRIKIGKDVGWVRMFLVGITLILLNYVISYIPIKLDLTEEKRFTLTPQTKKLLHEINDQIYVEILLQGKFPAGFKRLQEATKDMLNQFRAESSNIQFQFYDPLENLSINEKNQKIKELFEQEIRPTTLKVFDNNEKSEQIIYPVCIVKYGDKNTVINLLEPTGGGITDQEAINNSVNLLEYKLTDGITKLFRKAPPIIAFTKGHGEVKLEDMSSLIKSVGDYYQIKFFNLDSVYKLPEDVKLLVIANPQSEFSEKEKFVLDQYVMRGGNLIFSTNKLSVSMDSLRTNATEFIPSEKNTNLDDMFFKYGARIQSNLVLDLECSKIPLRIGTVNNTPQFELFPWYYSPIIASNDNHVIVKNIDRVNLSFCSTIDTIKTKASIDKTFLLQSSAYSRVQFAPVRLNFEILRYKPDPSKFDKGKQLICVLLEGMFNSLYENRVSPSMLAGLKKINLDYLHLGNKNSKILIISSGQATTNPIKANGEIIPLGFNSFEQIQYGNKDFILNAIEYMFDEKGILNARAKETKLRLLDNIKVNEELTFWQILNLIIPLSFIVCFSFTINALRKRQFASKLI